MSCARVTDHGFLLRKIRAVPCLHRARCGYESLSARISRGKPEKAQELRAPEQTPAEARAVPLGAIPDADLREIRAVLGPPPLIRLAERVDVVVPIACVSAGRAAEQAQAPHAPTLAVRGVERIQ